MTLRAGQEAVVRVAVATLWTSPEKVRLVDAPALAVQPDIPGWIAGMSLDQQVGDCVLSQLLLGERVLVTEVRPDGWAHIVALEQSAPKLHARGYPGWVPAAQLAPAPNPEPEATHVVNATATHLRATPDGAVVLPHVILGTRLSPAGEVEDGWRPVWVPGHDLPRWLPDAHLAPIPTRPPTADEVFAVANRLTEVTYIWGGVSTFGIDCSGLVHLVWRRLGVRLPRDADDQAAATTAVTLGEELPGDLYFFARPDRPIHHIGIVTTPAGGDTRRMLDACYVRRKVNNLPLSADRIATLVAAHRVG